MGKSTLYELAIDLTFNTGKLEKGEKLAKGKIDSVTNSFKGLKEFALVAGTAIGTLAGGLAFLKSSMEKVDGPGDRLEAVIQGGKEAMFEMQRAIATMDFSNFVKNLTEGYERGKLLAEALDAIADQKAFTDYKIVGYELEVEQLREIVKNKQNELSVRADAAEKIKAIELDIKKRREEISNDTYNEEKKGWEGRNKLTIDEATKLFENINNIETNGYKQISADSINQLNKLFDGSIKVGITSGKSKNRAIKDSADMMKDNLVGTGNNPLISSIPKEDLNYLIDTYTQFKLLSEGGEEDIWQKLFTIVGNHTKEITTAQKDYNAALGQTSMLMAKEEKAEEKIANTGSNTSLSTSTKMSSPLASASPLQSFTNSAIIASNSHIGKITISVNEATTAIDKMNTAFAKTESVTSSFDKFEKVKSDLANINVTANNLSSSLGSLGSIIGGVAGDMISFVGTSVSALASLATTYVQLYAQAFGAGAIQALSSGASLPYPYNLIAMSSTLATFLGLAASIPKLADGGIAYGNSIVNVGEYSNARSNPEVIAPLDKLRGLIGGGTSNIKINSRIKADDLIQVIDKRRSTLEKY